MQIKKTVTVAVAALLLTGAAVGAATAGARSDRKATGSKGSVANVAADTSSEQPADTDQTQSGDQTGPETPDPNETQTSESATESGTETESPSDGPGGNEDPAGNVDHQFEGQE